MASRRILVISDSFSTLPEAVTLLEASGHAITYVDGLVSWADLDESGKQALREADAVIMGRVMGIKPAHFALAPNLRIIALHTSGSDNIDLNEATRNGILVTTVKGVNAEQCAEFAMGLMLSVVRQIRTGDLALRAGLWASRTQTSMDVSGSTLGVIGFGQIAQAFVRRAAAFGARILVHTRTEDPEKAKQFGIEFAPLDEVLRRSDIICLFAALTDESRQMIGRRELGLMKSSAYFINIARGELVDEQALVEFLQDGRLAGAGLDVFAEEPLLASPLFELENVVITPHQAGLTRAGKAGAALRAARSALQVLAGELPANAINPAAFTISNPQTP